MQGSEERETVGLPPVAFASGTPARSETQEMGAKGRPTMRSIALDLGNRITYARAEGGVVVERAVADDFVGLDHLLGPGTPRARVAIEASREAWFIHDTLKARGHEVFVVDTTRARQLGIGHHKRKNDRIDAGILALAVEAGTIPKAHVLSPHRRELRELLGVRRSLTETRSSFVTQVRGICRAHGVRLPKCSADKFLRVAAPHIPDAARVLTKPLLRILEELERPLLDVDAQLEAASESEPAIQRLKTIPGVGTVIAAAFVSVIDDPLRFDDAHRVQSYLGLVPAEFTSGRRKLGSITKEGNSYLRSLLVQGAWSLLRTRGHTSPLRTWAQAVQRRRGKKLGAVALARRLAGVMWAVWKNGTVFDPTVVGASSARGLREQAQRTDVLSAVVHRAGKDAAFIAAALKHAAAKTPAKIRRKAKERAASH